jgi:hypothetical protein
MKHLINTIDYDKTINIAKNMNDNYKKSVYLHCYWNGNLSEKHLYSIMSCYYFNKKHKIMLWLDNNIENNFNNEINKYCEIRNFNLKNELKNTFMENAHIVYYSDKIEELSNFYRLVLLYNYGGCWFDLDTFFLRNLDPLFCKFENEICYFQWQNQNYPSNGFIISLEKKSDKLKYIMEYVIKRKRGWGSQNSYFNYELPLDILALPCSWFSPAWIDNPLIEKENFDLFFKKTDKKYTLDTYFNGAFCYHWHNRWNYIIEEDSIFDQLSKEILNKLEITSI